MIPTKDDISAIHERFMRDSKLSWHDKVVADDLVMYLTEQLELCKREDRGHVASFLVHELGMQGKVDRAEKLLIALLDEFPDDILFLHKLAMLYAYERADGRKAWEFAKKAEKASCSQGRFIVHTLNMQCRLARKMDDFPLLAETIEKLLAHKIVRGSMDSVFENDFLCDLPDGAVPADRIAALNARCKKWRE